MLKSTTGAAIIVNDTGIYISNGKGAMITLVGRPWPSTKPRWSSHEPQGLRLPVGEER